MPTLFVVPTPIGNLEDITLRALSVLREVDTVIVEDMRVTRRLLSHYGITTPLLRYDSRRIPQTLESLTCLWQAGKSVALVSDAGMPAIADPGRRIIQEAYRQGIRVSVLPGANAALCGLVASGMMAGQFVFLGFPPRTKSDHALFFSELRQERRTLVLYESPPYLASTLMALKEVLGGSRSVALAFNLTKPDETVTRGTLTELCEQVTLRTRKGEYVVIVEGKQKREEESVPPIAE